MNFRVLLIGEDTEVIKKLKAFILKKEGLELVDELSAGYGRLSFFKQCQPDILIFYLDCRHTAEIKLIEDIRNDFPVLKIILVLSFSDFKYAQKAINEWKVHYLIEKSQISENILKKILDSALQELNADRLNNSSREKIKELTEKLDELSLYVLHRQVIIGASEHSIRMTEKFLGRGLDFDAQEFYLGFCGLNNKIYSEYNIEEYAYNRFFLNLRSRIRKICISGYKVEVFMYSAAKNFILIFSRENPNAAKRSIDPVIEEVHRIIQNEFEDKIIRKTTLYQNFTVISERLSGLGRCVRDVFQHIIRIYQLSFFIMEQRIVKHSDIESLRKPYNIENVNRLLDHTNRALVSGRKTRLDNAIRDLFIGSLKYYFNKASCSYALDYLKQLYINVSRSYGIVPDINLDKEFNIDEYICIEQACENICRIFDSLQSTIMHKMSSKSIIVQGAKSYIKQNYAMKISLVDISEYVCISPSYLCRMFKQETGETLNQYITAIRVENAKKLFDDSNLKICEVCEKSGFPNPKYFSQVFKKITGMTPKEYKEKVQRG